MAMARRSSVVMSALLVALLACTTTIRVAVAYSICDDVNCGEGSCAEAPGLIPGTVGYECDCDARWSRVLTFIPSSPCIIPNSIDPACFNLTLKAPRGVPMTDPCAVVDCGSGGTCRNDKGMNFHCECNPGYVNLRNVTFLPCIKNSAFGPGCSTLGLPPPPASPPSSAPSGNRDSSGPTGPPSSPKGYATALDSICDHANCGKGSCAEVPGLIPGTVGYECDCDAGWSRVLKLIPFSPCIIPNSYDPACFNLTLKAPRSTSLRDPCVVVDCGSEGTCRKDEGMNFHCECNPGYVNMLNVTFLPCIKPFGFGPGCSTLPPPASPPSSAPSGNHDPSGPTAPPSSSKDNATALGSVSLQSLLQLLLLVSLATVQIM